LKLGSQNKASLVNEMEKEFLRGVRLSDLNNMKDTVTVHRHVVEHPDTFFDNLQSVSGQDVSEHLLLTEYEPQHGHFKSKTPDWFSPYKHCSIA